MIINILVFGISQFALIIISILETLFKIRDEEKVGLQRITRVGLIFLSLQIGTILLSAYIGITAFIEHADESKKAAATLVKQQEDTAFIKGQLVDSQINADKALNTAKEHTDAVRSDERFTHEMLLASYLEINELQNKGIETNEQLEVTNKNVIKLTRTVEDLKTDYSRLGESYGVLLLENKELRSKLSIEADPEPPPPEKVAAGDTATILAFPRASAFILPGQKEDIVLGVVYTVRDKRYTYFLTSGAGSHWERAANVEGSDTFALVRTSKKDRSLESTGFSVAINDAAKQTTKEATLAFDGVANSQMLFDFEEAVPDIITVTRFPPKP